MSGEDDYFSLRIVILILTILCYIGYIFVFFMYWFFKELRSFSFELVIWLCVSSCFYSFSGFIWPDTSFHEYSNYSSMCVIQSLIITIFESSTLIITCIIGYTTYINILNSRHLEQKKNSLRLIFLSLTTIVPLILGSFVYFMKLYGTSGSFCWLDLQSRDEKKKKYVNKFDWIFHIFTWFLITINAYFILKVIYGMKRMVTEDNRKFIERTSSRLRWYPIVLFFCNIPPTVNKIYSSISNKDSLVLTWICSIVDSSQGILFVIVYCFTPEVNQACLQLLHKILGRKTSSIDSERSSIDCDFSRKVSNLLVKDENITINAMNSISEYLKD